MAEVTQRGKAYWSGIFIVIGLIALTPFVKWVLANIFDLLGIFLFVTTISGYFIFEGLRHKSEQVDLMREGDHISRSQVGVVAPLGGTAGQTASRLGITYGGLEVPRLSIANRHLLNVPASAVERMEVDDHEDYLVYAPSVSLTAEQHFGIDSAMSDIAEQSLVNAFRTGDGSKSQARFSVFNSLVVEPTADQLRLLKDEILRSAKKTAEGKRKGEESEYHNIKRLRKLAEITRRPSLFERIERFFFGGGGGSTPSEKPSGEEGE